MRLKKIMLLAVLSLGLSSCSTLDFGDSLEARARRNRRYFPIIVSALPEGFVPLDTVIEDMGGILSIMFWSTNFGIIDSEGITTFQTDVHDDSFIVIFRNQYYVCENQFSQILDHAMNIREQQDRMYSIGEAMEIRGRPSHTIYTITIASVERLEMDTVAVYEINFSIYPSVDSNNALAFFEAVVLKSGNRLHHFILTSEETMTMELSRTEFVDMLVLNIPESLRISTIQNSIRMVRIHDCDTGTVLAS